MKLETLLTDLGEVQTLKTLAPQLEGKTLLITGGAGFLGSYFLALTAINTGYGIFAFWITGFLFDRDNTAILVNLWHTETLRVSHFGQSQ